MSSSKGQEKQHLGQIDRTVMTCRDACPLLPWPSFGPSAMSCFWVDFCFRDGGMVSPLNI